MRNVVDVRAGRAFAVELREKRHHSATDFGIRERGPGGSVIIFEWGQIRPGLAGLIALQESIGTDHHGFRRDAGATQDSRGQLQVPHRFGGRRDDQLKLDGRIAARREARDFS